MVDGIGYDNSNQRWEEAQNLPILPLKWTSPVKACLCWALSATAFYAQGKQEELRFFLHLFSCQNCLVSSDSDPVTPTVGKLAAQCSLTYWS